jgi:hypothetical protein
MRLVTTRVFFYVEGGCSIQSRPPPRAPGPPLPFLGLLCFTLRRHFALSTLTFLSTFCGTLAMAHAAGNSVEAVIGLGAEPSFEVGAWPVASDDDDGRW